MSERAENIRILFSEHVEALTKKVPVNVMLGDGTVSEQESFNPSKIKEFFENFLKKVPDWNNNGVTTSSDQDLRRIFIKFEIKEGNYLLSSHVSLQYHALLFYKLDHYVIDIQKQLSDLSDKVNAFRVKIGPENDKIIEEKLRQKGYHNMDYQNLFEVLFEHDDITQEIIQSIQSSQKDYTDLTSRRDQLFRDLDDLLIEVYHTSPVLIDEIRMIAAEEGCLCNFNLEYLKNNIRQGNINLSRIPERNKINLIKKLENIMNILKS
jgi:hypothetical protein